MSADRPDDFDDVPNLRSIPSAASDDGLRADYRDELPPRKPGFGFWMAVVWCILYVLVMQVLAACVCGLPIYAVALGIEVAQNGMEAVKDETKLKAWMEGPNGRLAMMSTLIASHLVGLLFSWIVLRWRVGGRRWKRRIALTRPPAITHWVLILIGLPAMLALSTAVEQPIMEYVPSIQDLLNRAHINFEWPGIEVIMPLLQKTPLPLAIFAVAILPALNEEFWCRGFIAQGLAGRYRTWAVVLVTSFLFGVIHLEPRQGIGAMLLGAAIHGAYLATRSLWAAMFVHFANNGLAVLHVNEGFPLAVLKPLEDTLKASPVLFVASSAVLFGAVMCALYQTRCKLVSVDPSLPTWEPSGVSTVELPPPGSGTVVTHDPLSPVSVALVLVGAVAFGAVMYWKGV